VADVLVEDPVCHKLVPKQQAIRLKSKKRNEIIYFCSEECCELFVRQEGEKK
jgi:YHS domain-containing protein